MLQTDPLTRSRSLDMLADRLRDAFGEALQALYVLPDNPYEPAGDDEWLVLAAVLGDSYYGPTTEGMTPLSRPRRLGVRSRRRSSTSGVRTTESSREARGGCGP